MKPQWRSLYVTLLLSIVFVEPSAAQYSEKWFFNAPDVGTYFVFVDAGNTDADPQEELLYSYGQGSVGVRRLYLFDGLSGQVDWDTGTTFASIVGQRLEDVDADGRDEIVFSPSITGGVGQWALRVFESDAATFIQPAEATASIHAELMKSKPNPFNPSCTITFRLQSAGQVSLIVYDTSGREIKTLVDKRLEGGEQAVTWDGRDNAGAQVQSGMYLYRLVVDGRPVEVEKAILLR